MFKPIRIFLLAAIFLLSACGGGSSSGGGGEVTYKGTYKVNGVATGGSPATASTSGTFSATVKGDVITITLDDGSVVSAQITGADLFSISVSIVGLIEGCTSGTISISGQRPDGTTFSAIITGNKVVCDGIGIAVTGSLSGSGG